MPGSRPYPCAFFGDGRFPAKGPPGPNLPAPSGGAFTATEDRQTGEEKWRESGYRRLPAASTGAPAAGRQRATIALRRRITAQGRTVVTVHGPLGEATAQRCYEYLAGVIQ